MTGKLAHSEPQGEQHYECRVTNQKRGPGEIQAVTDREKTGQQYTSLTSQEIRKLSMCVSILGQTYAETSPK